MPSLSTLKGRTRDIPVDLGDDMVINMSVRVNAITPRIEQEISNASDENRAEVLVSALSTVIASWDVTDDNGVVIAPSPEFLMDFPSAFILKLFEGIREALNPGESNGATSAAG